MTRHDVLIAGARHGGAGAATPIKDLAAPA